MEEQKTFAVIKDGIVENAIIGEALAIVQALIPDAFLVEVNELTGPAYIGGKYENGKFYGLKPYESWVLNETTRMWDAPVEEPVTEPGYFAEWNEEKLDWDIIQIPIAN